MSGFLEILIFLGALQGFILSLMLFFKKSIRPTNRILASLIFLMALASLNLYVTGTGLTHLGSADARDRMHAN